MKIETPYLFDTNNVKIKGTSANEKFSVDKILSKDKKQLWLSDKESFPIILTIDVKNMIKRPKKLRGLGIYCSSNNERNPKIVEFLYSKNDENYISLGSYELSLCSGLQVFNIDEIDFDQITNIKLFIKQSFGGNRTYINNIYLYEYPPTGEMPNQFVNTGSTNNNNITDNNGYSNSSTSDKNKQENRTLKTKSLQEIFSESNGSGKQQLNNNNFVKTNKQAESDNNFTSSNSKDFSEKNNHNININMNNYNKNRLNNLPKNNNYINPNTQKMNIGDLSDNTNNNITNNKDSSEANYNRNYTFISESQSMFTSKIKGSKNTNSNSNNTNSDNINYNNNRNQYINYQFVLNEFKKYKEVNNNIINNLDNRITIVENELGKLSDNINNINRKVENIITNINNNKNKDLILNECNKLINSQLEEFFNNYIKNNLEPIEESNNNNMNSNMISENINNNDNNNNDNNTNNDNNINQNNYISNRNNINTILNSNKKTEVGSYYTKDGRLNVKDLEYENSKTANSNKISSKASYFNVNRLNKKYNSNINSRVLTSYEQMNTISTDNDYIHKNYKSLEEKLDRNLDQKFVKLSKKFGKKIFAGIVKPSLHRLEVNLEKSLTEVKRQINSLSHNKKSSSLSYRRNKSNRHSLKYINNTYRRYNNNNKNNNHPHHYRDSTYIKEMQLSNLISQYQNRLNILYSNELKNVAKIDRKFQKRKNYHNNQINNNYDNNNNNDNDNSFGSYLKTD